MMAHPGTGRAPRELAKRKPISIIGVREWHDKVTRHREGGAKTVEMRTDMLHTKDASAAIRREL